MKLALCNEVLRQLPFDEQCRLAAALGYNGLELAPFTLADDPSTLTRRDAAALARRSRPTHGLAISSLHWLLVQARGPVAGDARRGAARAHGRPARAT